MKSILIRSVLFASAILICLDAGAAMAKAQSGSKSTQQSFGTQRQTGVQTEQTLNPSAAQRQNTTGLKKSPVIEPDRPWKLSSRIHLEKGTNKGYLVVQLDLDEGHHVYSLNPEGSPSPTRLAVLPSNDLKVQSKFASDKAPIVIEKDPVFEQRIEKHKGQVQFFASIIVRPGIDLQKLTQEVQFSGQVCSDSACQLIREQTASAKFAGYFAVPKSRNASTTDQKLK